MKRETGGKCLIFFIFVYCTLLAHAVSFILIFVQTYCITKKELSRCTYSAVSRLIMFVISIMIIIIIIIIIIILVVVVTVVVVVVVVMVFLVMLMC